MATKGLPFQGVVFRDLVTTQGVALGWHRVALSGRRDMKLLPTQGVPGEPATPWESQYPKAAALKGQP